jgi:hypothetical protein
MNKTLAEIITPNRPENFGGAHISERMLACLVGLPRICAIRACRRHKRCYGPDAICLHHHNGLVDERVAHHKQLEKDIKTDNRQ